MGRLLDQLLHTREDLCNLGPGPAGQDPGHRGRPRRDSSRQGRHGDGCGRQERPGGGHGRQERHVGGRVLGKNPMCDKCLKKRLPEVERT